MDSHIRIQSGSFTRRINKSVISSCSILAFSLLFVTSAQAEGIGSGVINFAIRELCGHMLGHLGALLTVIAGFGALVAAAFGAYRAFYSAIITAIGAFTIPAIMSIYFPEAANVCNSGAPDFSQANGFQPGDQPNFGPTLPTAPIARTVSPEIYPELEVARRSDIVVPPEALEVGATEGFLRDPNADDPASQVAQGLGFETSSGGYVQPEVKDRATDDDDGDPYSQLERSKESLNPLGDTF